MKEIRVLRASEIECRVGQTGKSRNGVAWCSLLLYKDARCDQRVLDETFGIFGWKKSYTTINGGLFCTVSIKDPESGEWVEKQDIGTKSNTEAEKGEASDAMKRACFNIGIGRELYTAPKIFITLGNNEYYMQGDKVKLSPKCVFTVTEIGYDEERNIKVLTIVDNNNVVRYKLGQVAEPAATEESSEFNETMRAYIIPALEQANDEQACKQVWDDYKDYQKIPEFVAAVTDRLNKIRSAA